MRVLSKLRRSVTAMGGSSPCIFQALRFSSTLTSSNLFVGGVCRQTTDDELKEAFLPSGQLVEAKVVVDELTGRSKGFAFVTYRTIEEAEKARDGMNAKFFDGWIIFVDPARERVRRPPQEFAQDSSDSGFRTSNCRMVQVIPFL